MTLGEALEHHSEKATSGLKPPAPESPFITYVFMYVLGQVTQPLSFPFSHLSNEENNSYRPRMGILR